MTETPLLTPSRLVLARKRQGMTLVRLSKSVGVSTRSLSDYENGRSRPNWQIMKKLAETLEVTSDFLIAPEVEEIPLDRVSFRALSKLTASQRDTALASARIAVMINDWIEERFKLPPCDVPTLPGRDPEAAAQDVRALWGLGKAPIGNMVHLLESRGVRVFSLAKECYEVDAFSYRWKGQPFILLNTSKSGERGRFDGAHELGHLVLHSEHEIPHGREAESVANHFSSAFLMPNESIEAQRLYNATADRIIAAKGRWKVSAMALNYRLKELNMLTEWTNRENAINLSRLGYRRGEPGGIQRESSQLLSKVFRELRAEGITPMNVSADLGISASELSNHVFGLVPTALSGGGQKSPDSRVSLRLLP